ncbi:hypothetical protein [Bacillus cereus]|uniref:hypothetical protein n=1 Tax=Bacillus cereus TaxID=1396 RepID=UPI000BFCDC90|nr:hypothetical protein [Bacillus cereus]PGT07240.1 hypothetical protein COD03_27295 [Bacillus cereus]
MDLLSFMRKNIKKMKRRETKLLGNFQFKVDTWKNCRDSSNQNNNGVVYGLACELDKKQKEMLIKEAKELGGLEENNRKIKPIKENYFVLYWGESDIIYGRGMAHVNGHKGNSNLHLNCYKCLENHNMIYAYIFVEDCNFVEEKLKEQFPPLLKTFKVKY